MGGQRELFHIDIVRKGIGLNPDRPTISGERLGLTFALPDPHRVNGTLLVTHVNRPRLGGCITAISGEHQQQLTRYIEDHAAASLTAV